jgi:hypothetical protein
VNNKAIFQVIQWLIFTVIGLIFFSVNTITFNGYILIKPFDVFKTQKKTTSDATKQLKQAQDSSLVPFLKQAQSGSADSLVPPNKNKFLSDGTLLHPLNSFQMDTTPQRILMVGESMIEGLYLAFRKMAVPYHHTVKAKIWYGSRIIDWGKTDTLTQLIRQFKPTFIVVSIASNELFIKKLADRQKSLDSITSQLKGYRYIWIGPPIPKRDYGIDSMIKNSVLEGCYYTSKYHKFKRRRDGVHPKREESYRWADSIAVWVETKSRYPIKLIAPKAVKDTTKEESTPPPKSKKVKKNADKK